METCNYYEETKRQRPLSEFEQGMHYAKTGYFIKFKDEIIGRCNGTKERDVCTCGGDRRYCTFYRNVREKAIENDKAVLDKIELEFYRDYVFDQGLLYDALNKYEKWKNTVKGA